MKDWVSKLLKVAPSEVQGTLSSQKVFEPDAAYFWVAENTAKKQVALGMVAKRSGGEAK